MNHLTLDQCKKLKELGYPQDTFFGWEVLPSGKALLKNALPWPDYADWTKQYGKALIACPTLEELIDWLGEDFYDLMREDDRTYTAHMNGDRGEGKTPLEAVYNLCVALKEPANQPE